MSKSFAQYLVDQAPVFDEMILKDMWRPYLHILPRDVKLLPNNLRRVWSKPLVKTKRNRKRFRLMRFARDKIQAVLEQRIEQWLNRLPKQKAKLERKIRTYSDSGWIGGVKTGTVPMGTPIQIPQDRFNGLWKPIDKNNIS